MSRATTTRTTRGWRLAAGAAMALATLGIAPGVANADGGAGVYNVMVSESPGVVTASWFATAYFPIYRVKHTAPHDLSAHTSTAVYFTCTLLLGFNNVSSFTQSTTQHTCSFYNLDTSLVWGVEVQEVFVDGGALGPAQTAWGQAIPAGAAGRSATTRSIVCKRGARIFAVTGVNPVCPAHSHRVG